MEFKHETWPLLSFKEEEKDINPNPPYQRGLVWKDDKKELLIDSILRKIDLPKIYLRKISSPKKWKYEIIDGQQRMKTLWDYLNDKFSLPEEADDLEIDGKKYSIESKKYSQLDSQIKIQRIHKYALNVIIIENAEEDEIADLFFRLNNGVPLTPAEVRHSMPGKFSKTVQDLSSHNFFSKLSFANRRFSHEQICAQMLAIELSEGPMDVRDKYLSKIYSEYKKNMTPKKIEEFIGTLDLLDNLFTSKSRLLNKAQTINIFILISFLRKEKKIEKKIQKAFLSWYTRTEPKRLKNYDYKLLMTSSSSSKNSIYNRFQILLIDYKEEFFKDGFIELDKKRVFDENQKVEIYANNNGTCQICKKKVNERNWHADHIIPWIKGGKTEIKNGQVLCPKDNLSKKDKIWK